MILCDKAMVFINIYSEKQTFANRLGYVKLKDLTPVGYLGLGVPERPDYPLTSRKFEKSKKENKTCKEHVKLIYLT